jgi:hypothetical protein
VGRSYEEFFLLIAISKISPPYNTNTSNPGFWFVVQIETFLEENILASCVQFWKCLSKGNMSP